MRRIRAVVVILLISSPLAIAQKITRAECGWGRSIPAQSGDGEVLYRGEYCNYDYAYRVLLPTGVVAHGSMPPSPNHGFGILPAEPSASRAIGAEEESPYLYAGAEYPSYVDSPSLDSIVRANLRWLTKKDTREVKRAYIRLAGIPAVRLALAGDATTKLVVIAYRRDADVVYTVGLTTIPERLTVDEVLFNNIVTGFRLQSRPKP